MEEVYLAYINYRPRLFRIRENAEKFICKEEYNYYKKRVTESKKFDKTKHGTNSEEYQNKLDRASTKLDEIYNSDMTWENKRKEFMEPLFHGYHIYSLVSMNDSPRFEVVPIKFEDNQTAAIIVSDDEYEEVAGY